MKKQQLLQEQGDPRPWEKQETSKATLMLCLKPTSLQGSLYLLCYKWILAPLSPWALVTDFKGGQDLSFRFWKADTQLRFLQSTHKVRKNTSIMLAMFYPFQQLLSSTWLPGVIAVLFLRLTSSLFLDLCLAQTGPHFSVGTVSADKPQETGHWITD